MDAQLGEVTDLGRFGGSGVWVTLNESVYVAQVGSGCFGASLPLVTSWIGYRPEDGNVTFA